MKKSIAVLTLCALLLSSCAAQKNSNTIVSTTAASNAEISDVSENGASDTTTAVSEMNSSSASETTASSSGDVTSSADTSSPNVQTTTSSATTAADTTVTTTTTATSAVPQKPVSSSKLSAYATEYEGREQTSDFNYGEALQKSILFYDLQRTGDLPENFRSNWRGDSCLNDGSDVGLDLSGGFLDAGDNVKFNLPMSYTCSMLSWSVTEDYKSYEESGQLQYILDNIRWGNDYFIKCHPEANVYYYQVGDGNADHSFWGSAEVVEAQMKRPSYKVDMNNGGSTVTAATAASLASAAVVFKDIDSAYSEKCLKHAKELFSYSETVKSDSGYTAANGFYTSNSGFKDEQAWAAYWLYKATGDNAYLEKSKKYLSETSGDYKWAHCWDDVSYGTSLLLAKETGEKTYKDRIEKHFNFWLNEIKYTPKGLAWLDQWGALRYSSTTAFLMAVYADSDICPADKKDLYNKFAKSQIDYALGSSGRSYVIGYGENSPKNPHHRTAHGAYSNNIAEPAETKHILFGALVGGPDSGDNYSDDRNNYINNEVACDYNAGFTGALAKLYKTYGGKTLVNFGAVEKEGEEELYADATINVSGQDFIEIKALVYNKTSTPARVADDLKLCYFFDISEIIAAGGSADTLQVTTNYMQGGSASDVMCWNEEKNLYYVAIDFSGVNIYPGSQESFKKEVQFRVRNTAGVWDNSNDPSYMDVAAVSSGTLTKAYNLALYEGNKLVFGTEPNEKNTGVKIEAASGNSSGNTQNNQNTNVQQPSTPAANVSDKGTVSVELLQQATQGSANTISFTVKVKNTGSTGIDLSKLSIDYLFTKDGSQELAFWCDYADISGSDYKACTDTISGVFSSASGNNADTKCTMKSSGVLAGGDTLQIQVRITKSDWSNFDLGNDYSSGKSENIKVVYNGKELS